MKMDFDRTYADYLGNKDIKAIAKLEKKIGKRLLAYYTPPATSNLDEDVLARIQDLEKKICVRLVAYDSN
jgi:guanylate kinase